MNRILLDTLTIADIPPVAGYCVPDDGIEGLEFAEVRIGAFDIPEQDGAFISRTSFGGRVVSFPVKVLGDTAAEYLANRAALIAVLKPKRLLGRAVLRTALFELDDGSIRRVEYVTGSFRLPFTHSLYAEGFVMLECPDPAILGESETVSVTLSEGGGYSTPYDTPYDILPRIGGSVVATNSGNTDAYPVITVRGPVTNPTITNSTTGHFMTLSGASLTAGESITIDTKARTILKGSQNYYYTKTAVSSFWPLASGNNTILFTDSGYDAAASVSVTFSPTWGGI